MGVVNISHAQVSLPPERNMEEDNLQPNQNHTSINTLSKYYKGNSALLVFGLSGAIGALVFALSGRKRSLKLTYQPVFVFDSSLALQSLQKSIDKLNLGSEWQTVVFKSQQFVTPPKLLHDKVHVFFVVVNEGGGGNRLIDKQDGLFFGINEQIKQFPNSKVYELRLDNHSFSSEKINPVPGVFVMGKWGRENTLAHILCLA